MKDKAFDVAIFLGKLVLYALAAFFLFSVLKGCEDDADKKSEQRRQEIIYDFMDDYGNPGERIYWDSTNPDDLAQSYVDGEIDDWDLWDAYNDLYEKAQQESWKWEDCRDKHTG